MLVRVTFEARSANANDGNIVVFFQDEEGLSGAEFVGKVAVVSPTGEVLYTFLDPEATFSEAGSDTILIPIPLDAAGNYLRGDYIFSVELDDTTAGSGAEIAEEFTYNYCPHNSPDHTTSDLVKMTAVLDCETELFTAEDITDYTDVTRLTRILTITRPAITGLSPATTGGDNLVVAVTYTNVTYSALLDVSFEYQEEDVTAEVTVISTGSAAIFIEVLADCDANMCGVVNCLIERFNTLNSRAQKAGGWQNLDTQSVANYRYVESLVNLSSLARLCNNSTQARTYLAEAKNLLNCDCGCSDTVTPKPL